MPRKTRWLRTLAGAALGAVTALVAYATTPGETPTPAITVEQLEQVLAGAQSLKDAKLAEQIAALELSERPSAETLAQIEKNLPGPKSRAAVTALADGAAFLSRPGLEVPSAAPPDRKTQLQIVSRTIDYVQRMRPRLPNFSALRSTMSFEIATPQQILEQKVLIHRNHWNARSLQFADLGRVPAEQTAGLKLFMVGTWSSLVTYRNGEEVADSGDAQRSFATLLGLTTTGEFGPVLSVVMEDSIEGNIVWDRWDSNASGRLAVFHYFVPKGKSHFAVDADAHARPGSKPVEAFPAYQGEIAVEPESGTIARVSMTADMTPISPRARASLVVEYGPVQIAGVTYICPVHGVAISQLAGAASDNTPHATFLNDVSFTDYHVFRSESRIIVDGDAGP